MYIFAEQIWLRNRFGEHERNILRHPVQLPAGLPPLRNKLNRLLPPQRIHMQNIVTYE